MTHYNFCSKGHKGIHIINVPPMLTYLIGIAMKTVSEKIRNRIKIYKSFDDETFDVIDKKSLPKEYGGTVEMKEMSSKFI